MLTPDLHLAPRLRVALPILSYMLSWYGEGRLLGYFVEPRVVKAGWGKCEYGVSAGTEC